MTSRRLERLLPWLLPGLLPLAALPALWHFLTLGLPQHSADGLLHLFRVALLEKHVASGMLYPRWLPELVLGRGYPLLNFYGPASYYLALGFRFLGLGLAPSLIAAFAVLIVLAGLGAYLLARDLFRGQSALAALVSAVAYMYAPYLLTNAYIRGAIAEVAAQALLPWIFWSTGRLMARRDRRVPYLIALALSMAGLAISHNITLLFLPIAWLAYVAALWASGGRRRDDLLWALSGAAAAVGLSAFFTLPLAFERQYLASTAYEISARYVPLNVWTFRNFLDLRPTFEYTVDVPFQLGLVQLALAFGGLLLARRKDAAWLYWLGLAVVCALLIGAWATPLWLGSSILLVAQFPWRLLTFISLSLALFTGGIVAFLARPLAHLIAAAVIITLIICANTPRLDLLGWVSNDATGVVASISQFERDTGALGTGSSAEFMPRWVGAAEPGPVALVEGAPRVVAVEAADDYHLVLRTEGEQAGPLRLMTSYFPGWRAADETGAALAVSPSTDTGLLTVDVPAGARSITVWWAPTAVEWTGVALTVLTLLLLIVCAMMRGGRDRLLTAPLALLLALAAAVTFARPAAQRVQPVSAGVALDGVAALGARVSVDGSAVWLHPYWRVERTPSDDLRVRWQVQGSDGSVVLERESRPYHNATSADAWPPNTLVDDAYFLPLPDGLPAGDYTINGQLISNAGESEAARFGAFTLNSAVPRPAPPAQPLDVRFGGEVALFGYDPPSAADVARPAGVDTVARAGDTVVYTLHWQALTSLRANYHGFVHLLDNAGGTLAKRDQLAGGETRFAPLLWSAGRTVRDGYPLRIPADAASGVYWPAAGLYDFASLERLPVTAVDGVEQSAGDTAARLRPLKVLGAPPARPQTSLDVRIGDLARLTGYDLALPPDGLAPGATFTMTLHYRVDTPTAGDYTRFVHFFSPTLGMAAQQDSQPAAGHNPTWAWVAGESLTDTVALTVAPDAQPGSYQLRVGLYDPAANAARLPLIDPAGNRLPDDVAPLIELQVAPSR